MQKLYFVFAYACYYPQGGMHDYKGVAIDLDAALFLVGNSWIRYGFWNIGELDLRFTDMTIVASGDYEDDGTFTRD